MLEAAAKRSNPLALLGDLPRRVLHQFPKGRSLSDDVWRRRHRVIILLLWAHVVGLAIFGYVMGFGVVHSLSEAMLVAIPAILGKWRRFSRHVRAVIASFGLMTCSAILVHLSGGYIEMHFHFFVMVVVITLYQDWVPFVLAILYVVVQHGLGGMLFPMSVYNHPSAWANPWGWAVIHGVFVLAASAAAIVNWRLNELAQERRRLAEEESLKLQAREQAALAEAAALRKLDRTKDELVSVVSHELRTPLAIVVGFVELLLNREFDSDERRQYLNVMHSEGLRLTAILDDFLDLQRMESGQQLISPKRVDLRPLLSVSIDSAGEDEQRPIRLDLCDDLPEAFVDQDRLKQVVGNLVSNARKYSPDGGEVVLSASRVDGNLQIEVSDRGLGIPPEALPHLFEKFFRVDNTDRREIKGTGLGLAICRKIVEAHGGRIWAESDGLGQGSRFCFTIPLANAPTNGDARNVDVLVVEDDPSFGELLSIELSKHGLSWLRVASTEAAVQWIAEAQPRGVLLDLVLPGLQGDTFLFHLHQSKIHIPVVVLTVKDLGPNDRRVLADLGVARVFRKGSGSAAKAAEEIARLVDHSPVDVLADAEPPARAASGAIA
jgi:signal transduction histidine kinase/CheY-like chemotaxis protein